MSGTDIVNKLRTTGHIDYGLMQDAADLIVTLQLNFSAAVRMKDEAEAEAARLRNELQEARNACRDAYELAEHYHVGILKAKALINSTPMPVLRPGERGSRYAKAMSDAAQILHETHDEACIGGPKGHLWDGQYATSRAVLAAQEQKP